VRFPSVEEVIACNEAVRTPDKVSPTPEDDDIERVARALDRARATTRLDPDQIIEPDDPEFGDLLIAAARGEDVRVEIRGLFHDRAANPEPRNPLDALTAEAQDLGLYDE
jgi:hypothetical protein